MNFRLFTQLFNKIDSITESFVTDISSRSIAAITPVVSVGLTLSFITYAMLIMRGAIDAPVKEFLGRSVRIATITGIALTGGLYQSDIAGAIQGLPDELVTALVLDPAVKGGAAASIDAAAAKGFHIAGEAFEKSGFFEKNGLVYCMFGVIILITTSVFVALGGAILLLTKLILAVLAGLGPFFIVTLLWQPTARLFDAWVAQILNYILLAVLFSALFGLMLSIYSDYMSAIEFNGLQNFAFALGGASVLSIAMIVVLLKLPGLASALAGGATFGYLHELRNVRGGAVTAYAAGSGLIDNRVTRPIIATTRHVLAAGGHAAAVKGRAAYGYFKGTLNKTPVGK